MNPAHLTTRPGIPAPICAAINLPAFEDDKAAGKYFAEFCPSKSVQIKWTCKECEGRHWWSGEPVPKNIQRIAKHYQKPDGSYAPL